MLLASDRVEDALAEAEAVLAQDSGSPDGLALRVAVRSRQGEQERAIADALAALEADPRHRNALSLLAGIRFEEGDTDAAKALLEQAIEAYPKDVPLRRSLVAVYQRRGEPEPA